MMRMHIQVPPNKVVMAYNVDLGQTFPYLYLFAAGLLRWNPTDLRIEHTEMIPTPEGERCVQSQGHVNNFGNGLAAREAGCPFTQSRMSYTSRTKMGLPRMRTALAQLFIANSANPHPPQPHSQLPSCRNRSDRAAPFYT
jgi:hypothetical protein